MREKKKERKIIQGVSIKTAFIGFGKQPVGV